MKTLFLPALKCFFLLTVLTGLVYPLALTGLSQVFLPKAASGTIVRASDGGQPVGSALLGQNFQRPDQFWGRLSQTAEKPYNAGASGASNLGTSNPALAENAQLRVAALQSKEAVPVDLVTSSASGLDPHISPESAYLQIERVAREGGYKPSDLEALVKRMAEPATFGMLGQPRVNVLLLNQEMAKLSTFHSPFSERR